MNDLAAATAGNDRPLAPFLKMSLVLWALALLGAVLVLPYAVSLEATMLNAVAARTGLTLWIVLALSTAQTATLSAIAIFAGLWSARALGLGAPLIAAWLSRRAPPARVGATLRIAVLAGLLTGFVLIGLDRWGFANFTSVATLQTGAQPPAWQALLGSFYGGIDEEILLRLGLLSLLALALRTLVRTFGADRDVMLSTGVFWTANLVAALLFGLGHVPAVAQLAPLTMAVIVRTIALNGIAGLVFGALYRRYGLEWAMVAHFTADIVLHVVAAG
jgi:hypothetical protein